MFEKQLLTFLKGIKYQCEHHYPLCDNCPFRSDDYFGCEPKQFVNNLKHHPKNWDLKWIEGKLK